MAILKFNLQNTGNVTGIKVIGVGGGGSNAVSRMYQQGIEGVEYIICNTDKQALTKSPVPVKVQLGPSVCKGLGCGADEKKGEEAAKESIEEIKKLLKKDEQDRTDMVIITAGMGGGTGTGAAPVIAKATKEMGILTIAIVTTPFKYEGKVRMKRALAGIENLKQYVDGILIINNEKLTKLDELKGKNFKQYMLFADEVLFRAAKGIAEIITKPGNINVDFADVKRALENAGTIYMSTGRASGEDRAKKALDSALNSPLIEYSSINNAKVCVYNIIAKEILGEEVELISDKIQEIVGEDCDIIFGQADDPQLEDELEVILIVTGFPTENEQIPDEITQKKTIEIPTQTSPTSQDNIETPPQPKTQPKIIYQQNIPTPPPVLNETNDNRQFKAPKPKQEPQSLEERIKYLEKQGILNIRDRYTQQKIMQTPAYFRKKKQQIDNTPRPDMLSNRTIEQDYYGNLYIREQSFYKDKAD